MEQLNFNKLWIGGEWITPESDAQFSTYNPATGKELGKAPLGGAREIDRAVTAARKAFPIWSKMPISERADVLIKIADGIKAHWDEFAQLDCQEHGNPIGVAQFMVGASVSILEYNAIAGKALPGGESIPAGPEVLAYTKFEPVGVCGLITPWNVPLMMMMSKVAPALVAGNTCILKPPTVNSLIGMKFAEILSEIEMPAGTINVITGPGSVIGEAIASHPGVDLISFTGSSEVGRSIMKASSQTIKKLILELGGKNPFIVLPDADLNAAVAAISGSQYMNVGQVCSAPGRIYVHESVHDEFVEKFVAVAKTISTGDPYSPATMMGPLQSASHFDNVMNYIKSAVDEGATLECGGLKAILPAPFDKGNFLMPTVFSGVTQNMKVAREEIFGPVACIMKFSTEEEVIGLANDSIYGLCASVWTQDIGKANKFANAIEADSIMINKPCSETMGMCPAFLWGGGVKQSGLAKEQGLIGIYEYMNLKMVVWGTPTN